MRIVISEVESVNDVIGRPIRGIDLEVSEVDLELPLADFIARFVEPCFASLIASHKEANARLS